MVEIGAYKERKLNNKSHENSSSSSDKTLIGVNNIVTKYSKDEEMMDLEKPYSDVNLSPCPSR